ncbi:GNAT family N-acetyltransferase [Deinococcus roseus]|uniref:N-acetyltransferase domain-containing protein n=1 Tax=Deinococcus roseus TaxID=392414 RepID=A0ABQ2D4B7_9DEIO|nr:GNAT family N-acetyltransferase [Deinococcus roseus]GGJ44983.1 hypothetical protein GCM10008938_34000 [Deinococcus roseus]
MTAMTLVHLRTLQPADLPAYHTLMRHALEEHSRAIGISPEEWDLITLEALQKHLEDLSGTILVAENEEGLVATVRCQVHQQVSKKAHKGHVSWMYVLPEYRREGLATQLLDHLTDWARAEGLEWLNITVTVGQTEAQKFYRAFGFEIWGYETHGLKLETELGTEYFDLEHLQYKLSKKPLK